MFLLVIRLVSGVLKSRVILWFLVVMTQLQEFGVFPKGDA